MCVRVFFVALRAPNKITITQPCYYSTTLFAHVQLPSDNIFTMSQWLVKVRPDKKSNVLIVQSGSWPIPIFYSMSKTFWDFDKICPQGMHLLMYYVTRYLWNFFIYLKYVEVSQVFIQKTVCLAINQKPSLMKSISTFPIKTYFQRRSLFQSVYKNERFGW
jgi:hypothetical protein